MLKLIKTTGKTHSSFSPESLQRWSCWIVNEPQLPLNQHQRAVWSACGSLPEIRAWGMGPVMGVHVLSLWAPVAISIVISCCAPPLHYNRTSVSLQSRSHLSSTLSHIHTQVPTDTIQLLQSLKYTISALDSNTGIHRPSSILVLSQSASKRKQEDLLSPSESSYFQ